jgi:hypothetical protein
MLIVKLVQPLEQQIVPCVQVESLNKPMEHV